MAQDAAAPLKPQIAVSARTGVPQSTPQDCAVAKLAFAKEEMHGKGLTSKTDQ